MAMEQHVSNVIQLLEREQPWDEVELRKALDQFTSKTLRATCYHLQLRVIKTGLNKTDYKGGYVDLLVAHRHAKFAAVSRMDGTSEDCSNATTDVHPAQIVHVQQLQQHPQPTIFLHTTSSVATAAPTILPMGLYNNWKRKTKGCALRLLNVLFSEYFQARLEDLNRRGCRLSDDSFEMAQFWNEVATEFVNPRPEYAKIHSDRECFRDVDPNYILKHDARKLQAMWKEIMAKFMIAWKSAEKVRDNTNSNGTEATPEGFGADLGGQLTLEGSDAAAASQGADFLAFCGNRADVYYVHVWLTKKPALQTVLKLNVGGRTRPNTILPRQETAMAGGNESDASSTAQTNANEDANHLLGALTPTQWSGKVDSNEHLPAVSPDHAASRTSAVEDHGAVSSIFHPDDLSSDHMQLDTPDKTSTASNRLKRPRTSMSGTTVPMNASNDTLQMELLASQKELLQLQLANERVRRVEEQYDRAVNLISNLLKIRADGKEHSYADDLMEEIDKDLEYNLAWKRRCKAELERLHTQS